MKITRENYLDVMTEREIITLRLWLQIVSARIRIINKNDIYCLDKRIEDTEREYCKKLLRIQQSAMTVIDLYKRSADLSRPVEIDGITGLEVDDKVFEYVSILLDPHTYDVTETAIWED